MEENIVTQPVVEQTAPQTPPESQPTPPQEAPANTIDLAPFYEDGKAGVFSEAKIADLVKKYNGASKSARDFQSMYMKQQGASDDINAYFKDFVPDSSYADAMQDEGIKEQLDKFKKFAHENKIGTRAAEAIWNYQMTNLAKSGALYKPTEEELQQRAAAENTEVNEYNEILFKGLNRTREQNDAALKAFADSPNILTNDPAMKTVYEKLSKGEQISRKEGYKFATLIAAAIEHQGVPVVSGTIESADKAAFWKEYNSEKNPQTRQAIMDKFLASGGKL